LTFVAVISKILNKVRALDPCYHSLKTAEIFEQSLISLVSAKNTLDLILKLDVKKKKRKNCKYHKSYLPRLVISSLLTQNTVFRVKFWCAIGIVSMYGSGG
ncbi:hypothetical protein PanWU01x14_232950, partial [Parasponia andersonii]